MGVRVKLAELDKIRESKPTWSEIGERFKGSVKEKDGKLKASIPLRPDTAEGRRNRSDLLDMVAPSARLEADLGRRISQSVNREEFSDAHQQRAGTRKRFGMTLSHGIGEWWERKCREAEAKWQTP